VKVVELFLCSLLASLSSQNVRCVTTLHKKAHVAGKHMFPSVDFAFWEHILVARVTALFILERRVAALFLCLAESSWPTKGCPHRVFWPQGGRRALTDYWLTWTCIQLLEMHFNRRE